jgi:hypothetical protein
MKQEGDSYMVPMESNTEKGLKYFNYGFILYIIALVIMMVTLLALWGTLVEIMEAPDDVEEEDVLPQLAGVIAGICLGAIIILIALILFLIGLISIYSGRMEFGETHANSVQSGLIFIIIGVVINFVGGLAPGAGAQGVGVVSAILIALGFVYLIKEIVDEKGKQMLWLAGILYIVIAIVSAAVTIWLFTTYGFYDMDTVETEAEAEAAMNDAMSAMAIAMGVGSLSLIPLIMFMMVYRWTYARIKNRELQPTMPYPPPYPGPQPPQYPYQQYPPYQPPPYPPSGPPPGEGGPPPEGDTQAAPKSEGAVTPAAVPSEQGIIACPHCGTQIPAGSTVCPVCKTKL